MEELREKICRDGKFLPGGIVKVDGFINHQIDVDLMMKCANEFSRFFSNRNISKVVTIEASGIAPAVFTAYVMHLPVVVVKKKVPNTMQTYITGTVHSFTKDCDCTVSVSRDYLKAGDHVLFIDDFLAFGSSAMCMLDLCEKAGCTIEGMGFLVEKPFQGGGNRIREYGIPYVSLATIDQRDGKMEVK